MNTVDAGSIAMMRGDFEEAEKQLLQALALDQDNIQALCNSAVLYRITNRLDQALDFVDRCLKLDPHCGPAYQAFATVCEDLGEFKILPRIYEKAARLMAGDQNAAMGLATSLMRLHRFEEAWPAWDYARFANSWSPPPGFVVWGGEEPAAGKRILVIREGGYGDGIMFARWIPQLIEAGAEVGYFVWDSLHPVLQEIPCKLIGEKELINPEDWDYCCGLMSLPELCGMKAVADIPAPVSIPAQEMVPFVGRCIGICWRAEENSVNRKHRSLNVLELEPFQEFRWPRIVGTTWFSLCPGVDVPNWILPCTSGTDNWTSTARLIAGMDLVITVDTAVAHLAGSMGKPTWLLCPMRSDWRWFTERTDSPFYPSVRIFRQKDPLKWDGVIQEVRTALEAL